LLRSARNEDTRALVVCSLRDILVCQRTNQQQHDDRAAAVANEFFDVVLVHSDPGFARFEDSFRPSIPFKVPVRYTGFVVPRTAAVSKLKTRQKRIVVSAGGGIVGEPLLRLAIKAHEHLEQDPKLEMKVIAGPFMPEESWQELQSLALERKRLRLVRQVSDLCIELSSAAVSISQAGYNTCLDVLRAGVPALLVPFANKHEDEQRKRALRLQQLGAVKVLEEKDRTPEGLAAQIRSLMDAKFVRPDLDLNGAETSTELIESMLESSTHWIADFSGETSYAN
jgi:predicted glycosyltransferase